MQPTRILVVGGGIAGMSAAILLQRSGAHVDLVEQDPDWRVYGAGITLSGPTLRAFETVGITDSLLAEGWCGDGLDLLAPNGKLLATLPTPRLGRPDVPGGGGILRPVLARILRKRTLASGASVRCGTTVVRIDASVKPGAANVGREDLARRDGTNAVRVVFQDGRTGQYDLVIGADGLNSKVRQLLFPDAPQPVYTGQVSWRAVVPRPADITHGAMMLGPRVKAGFTPISRQEMYLFVTEPAVTPQHLSDAELPGRLREVLRPFGGLVGTIRDNLNEQSRIVYRPFFKILLPAPWFKGPVLIIGDAAHATTPHLASGAGIAVEDAIVLAEEMAVSRPLQASLQAFMARRFERCRMVVENSARLGELESAGQDEAHGQLMRQSIAALAERI